MSQVEKLLKYQEIDAKLLKIEREVQNSDERKNLMQAANFVTKAQERLDALDGKALGFSKLFAELDEKYAELNETLSDFENLDELLEGGADISFYKKNLTQLTDKLKSLRQEVNALNKSIREANEEFQSLYQKTRAMQKQGKEYQDVYEKFRAEKRKEIDAVKEELKALAADIDPKVLQHYQSKRSERIFPILCPAKSGRCTKCGSELSLAGKERLSQGGIVECDNCHRFLYLES